MLNCIQKSNESMWMAYLIIITIWWYIWPTVGLVCYYTSARVIDMHHKYHEDNEYNMLNKDSIN